jgi:hypothetical protein
VDYVSDKPYRPGDRGNDKRRYTGREPREHSLGWAKAYWRLADSDIPFKSWGTELLRCEASRNGMGPNKNCCPWCDKQLMPKDEWERKWANTDHLAVLDLEDAETTADKLTVPVSDVELLHPDDQGKRLKSIQRDLDRPTKADRRLAA